MGVAHLEAFFLVAVRALAFVLFAPGLGSTTIPATVRIGLGVLIAALIYPTIQGSFTPPTDVWMYSLAIITETFIGIIIGFSARLVLAAGELGGQVAGFQMGFGIANVIDPINETQLGVLAQPHNVLAILIFFSLNVHHIILRALVSSFAIVEPGVLHFSAGLETKLITMVAELFVVAVKIGTPLFVTVFMANLGMGLIARTVPQLNVFVVGFNVMILVGLLLITLSLPYTVFVIKQAFATLEGDLGVLLASMR